MTAFRISQRHTHSDTASTREQQPVATHSDTHHITHFLHGKGECTGSAPLVVSWSSPRAPFAPVCAWDSLSRPVNPTEQPSHEQRTICRYLRVRLSVSYFVRLTSVTQHEKHERGADGSEAPSHPSLMPPPLPRAPVRSQQGPQRTRPSPPPPPPSAARPPLATLPVPVVPRPPPQWRPRRQRGAQQ
jgi:hypothetical protein